MQNPWWWAALLFLSYLLLACASLWVAARGTDRRAGVDAAVFLALTSGLLACRCTVRTVIENFWMVEVSAAGKCSARGVEPCVPQQAVDGQ